MLDKLWDFIVDSSISFFIPLVCSYFALSSNLFLNVACEEAVGLEKFSNQCLAPLHYLCMGRTAVKNSSGEWEFFPRFDYSRNFELKTAASCAAVLPGFVLGTAAKTAALLQKSTREHYREMKLTLEDTSVRSNNAHYESIGLNLDHFANPQPLPSQGHQRRPGDENNLASEKKAMADITALLTKAKIPWWVDCGTCLGAYRYGGVIPWDEDVDIAVLLPDFDNVCRVLNQLDPKKYIVQDWSTRDFPKSYLKVFVRDSNRLVDVYFFKIHPEIGQLEYILAFEHSMFFPEWWKIRERRFKVPVAIESVFPLKKALFDGVEVNMPNDTVKYLQRYYGDNLDPAKVYNPISQEYEKDLTHPYWKRAYVH